MDINCFKKCCENKYGEKIINPAYESVRANFRQLPVLDLVKMCESPNANILHIF